MTKTLVALYDTGAEAERVVQALLADGFARSDIHLTLHHTQGGAAHHASPERDVAYAGATAGGDVHSPWRASGSGVCLCGGGAPRWRARGGRESR